MSGRVRPSGFFSEQTRKCLKPCFPATPGWSQLPAPPLPGPCLKVEFPNLGPGQSRPVAGDPCWRGLPGQAVRAQGSVLCLPTRCIDSLGGSREKCSRARGRRISQVIGRTTSLSGVYSSNYFIQCGGCLRKRSLEAGWWSRARPRFPLLTATLLCS